MVDKDPKETFIAELDREIQWEWHWEKVMRSFYLYIIWIIWCVRFLLLAFAIYQVKLGKNISLWTIFIIAALSMLNIALPLLSVQFKFQQRQEVHDRNARKYEIIKIQLLAGTISLGEAVERFIEIRERPTEHIIRQTP